MTIWGQGMKGLLHLLFITYHPKSIPYGTRRNLELSAFRPGAGKPGTQALAFHLHALAIPSLDCETPSKFISPSRKGISVLDIQNYHLSEDKELCGL